jgi:hypothetical protein
MHAALAALPQSYPRPLRRALTRRDTIVGTKTRIDVEKLLHWAYRDELPKRELDAGSGGGGFNTLAELGTIIDDQPYARPQRYAGFGKPHPDALLLDWLVNGLEDVTLQWPAGQNVLAGHLVRYVTKEDAFVIGRMRAQPAGLVRAHARMGTRPFWDVWYRFEPVMMANGRPRVQRLDRHGKLVDCSHGQRDYLQGGQCPVRIGIGSRPGERGRLGAPMVEIISARFEYLMWRRGLDELVERAARAGLTDWIPVAPQAPVAPWL